MKKKLEQNEYYEALNRFVSEAGLNGDDKKEYCQYFTVGGVMDMDGIDHRRR